MTLIIIAALLLIVLSLAGLCACSSMGRAPGGEGLNRLKTTEHHDGKVFLNEEATEIMASNSFWSMTKEWCAGEQVRFPETPPPIVRLDSESFTEAPTSGLRATWLGHNTVLLEIDGFRFITDPVFAKRVSPLKGIGPKRFHEPPISIADLPDLDGVIISHDHYDHLDYRTIKAIEPKTKAFYLPLGVGSHLEYWGIPEEKIVERGWWEEIRPAEGLTLACLPARHFSGRGLFDRNKTHWATWAIIGPAHRIFFGGDTGLTKSFEKVGEKYGPFDLTLMPIGAYGSQWPLIHLNPEEAVTAHKMVGGQVLLPIHWGTFNLAFHSWTEPVERLVVNAEARNVACVTPRPGQSFENDPAPVMARWWPDIPWEKAEPARTVSRREPLTQAK